MTELEKEIRKMTDKQNGWDDRVDGFVKEIIDIVSHYAEKLDFTPIQVFQALEKQRTYSYPNYYQWAKFPKLDKVMLFKNQEELLKTLQPEKGFRCPSCKGVSKSPYACDTKIKSEDGSECDWKAYGLFGTLGEGLRFTTTDTWLDKAVVDECFYPVALEENKKRA